MSALAESWIITPTDTPVPDVPEPELTDTSVAEPEIAAGPTTPLLYMPRPVLVARSPLTLTVILLAASGDA
jgi:hypothetical protein